MRSVASLEPSVHMKRLEGEEREQAAILGELPFRPDAEVEHPAAVVLLLAREALEVGLDLVVDEQTPAAGGGTLRQRQRRQLLALLAAGDRKRTVGRKARPQTLERLERALLVGNAIEEVDRALDAVGIELGRLGQRRP